MDFTEHNQRVARLWDDYHQGCPARVPVTIAFDEQFLLPRWGCTFRQYYADVPTQIDIQLKSQRWIRESIVQDAAMGLPAAWDVTPPCWNAENEFFGAATTVQENDYAWAQPLELSKSELLRSLQRLDARQRLPEWKLFRQYVAMQGLTRGREFCGRPVRTTPPNVANSTHGIFTKAAELRGLDQICLDVYEDPTFVSELLATITTLTCQRFQAWLEMAGPSSPGPARDHWGLCDDSLTMISAAQYEQFVLPCHQRLYAAAGDGRRLIHLCGHVQHLFKLLHDKLGIAIFNGPGVHIDLRRVIEEIGQPIEIQAQVAHASLLHSRADIEAEVRQLLRDEVKQRARLMLTAYVPQGTPLTKLRFFYECGKQHGTIPGSNAIKQSHLQRGEKGDHRLVEKDEES